MARRLWMGGEKEGWVERRARVEREGLERGGGYGGLILGQVREVFWGRGEEGGGGDGDGDGEGDGDGR